MSGINVSVYERTPPTMTIEPDRFEPDPALDPAVSKQRIAQLLSSALRLWLRTQVESVADLQVQIQSRNRQLLSGQIQQVSLVAEQVVYQGLNLGRVEITAHEIRVNIGQIIRGKPLKLLNPVPIVGEVVISEANLNSSLQAPLLANALLDFLTRFLKIKGGSDLSSQFSEPLSLQAPTITIGANHLQIRGQLQSGPRSQSIGVQTSLGLISANQLMFKELSWLPSIPDEQRIPATWEDLPIDLGSSVELKQLQIEPGMLRCCAQLTVMPSV
jgi:LmeA-like phospholipid-binding